MSKPYKIGYKRPPTNTRYKKGQSGNPKGRPKKIPSDEVALLDRLLSRFAHVREGIGKVRFSQIVIRRLLNEAAGGDLDAALFVLRHWRPQEVAPEALKIIVRGGLPEAQQDEVAPDP